ncbi:MAG: tRNA threonylcarbamoyladenosine dehydratase [Bacteroidales bacterium]|nr:tRNA threonylcarbamoyladenosine dehydratase [Bacteroidales bacterium]
MHWLSRTELLIGKDKLDILQNSHVLVVGLGGVGAYAAEQLCRAGIGEMTIVDGDKIESGNRNRQLPALLSTEGKEKALVMADRLMQINPNLKLHVINEYIKEERMIEILDHPYSYIVDAIDTLAPKVFLIFRSLSKNLPIVSSMGSGGKLDPTLVQVTDISKSFNCNLARMLRKRLHKLKVYEGVKVVFSPEKVIESSIIICEGENKKSTVGTISYLPPVFGCVCASVVIRDLIE